MTAFPMAPSDLDTLAQPELATATQHLVRIRDFPWEFSSQYPNRKIDVVVDEILVPLRKRLDNITAPEDILARLMREGWGQQVSSLLAEFLGVVGAVKAFTSQQRDVPSGERNDFISRVRADAMNVATRLIPIESYVDKIKSTELNNRLSLVAARDDAMVLLEGKLKELHKETIRVLKEAGVAAKGKSLKQQADWHRAASRTWLILSAALAASLICVVRYGMHTKLKTELPFPEGSWLLAANLAYLSIRALGVSVLSFALVASLRSYRAERHNQISNQQRVGALATLEAFRDIQGNDPDNTIRDLAAPTAFAPQPTGFLDKDQPSLTHLHDLAKSANSGT